MNYERLRETAAALKTELERIADSQPDAGLVLQHLTPSFDSIGGGKISHTTADVFRIIFTGPLGNINSLVTIFREFHEELETQFWRELAVAVDGGESEEPEPSQKKPSQPFLSAAVSTNDPVLVKVLEKTPKTQTIRASIERIYSARHGMQRHSVGSEIDFVYWAGWTNTKFEIGERGLTFLRYLSNTRLYEDDRGHLLVENVADIPYAGPLQWTSWFHIPSTLRVQFIQDPKRPWAILIPFDAIERYLIRLIDETNPSG